MKKNKQGKDKYRKIRRMKAQQRYSSLIAVMHQVKAFNKGETDQFFIQAWWDLFTPEYIAKYWDYYGVSELTPTQVSEHLQAYGKLIKEKGTEIKLVEIGNEK